MFILSHNMKNKEVSWAAKVFTETITFPGLFVTVVIVEFNSGNYT